MAEVCSAWFQLHPSARPFLSSLLEDVSYFSLGLSASISLWSEKLQHLLLVSLEQLCGGFCVSCGQLKLLLWCLIAKKKKAHSLLCSINNVPSYWGKVQSKAAVAFG